MLLSLVQIRADVLKLKKLLIEDFIGVMDFKSHNSYINLYDITL